MEYLNLNTLFTFPRYLFPKDIIYLMTSSIRSRLSASKTDFI